MSVRSVNRAEKVEALVQTAKDVEHTLRVAVMLDPHNRDLRALDASAGAALRRALEALEEA